MTENYAKRFTLRKEYFGGFVYDSQTAKSELITPQEYSFIESLDRADNDLLTKAQVANPEFLQRVKVFKKIGFIEQAESGAVSMVNIRVIEPLGNLPQGMLSAPIRVFDTYTKKCNFDCPPCYFSCNIFVEEERRSPEQTADILKKFSDAGTMEWRFTGGEALVQPDIFDAIGVAKNLGMNVGLYTNGWWSEQIAKKVFDSKLHEVVISLEGRREVNDKRRKTGAFDHALRTFDRIKEYNQSSGDRLNVTIATAVGKDNVGDVEFLTRLAAAYGFNINFMPLKPSGRARETSTSEMLTTEEYMEFSRLVQHMREDPEVSESGIKIIYKYKDLFCNAYPDSSQKPFPFSYSECGALTTAISMLPDGRVFACPFVLDFDTAGTFIGPNMNDVTVQEAWFHSNFEKFRNAQKVQCGDCTYYMRQCRGACRATVLGSGGEIRDGKLLGDDPYCYADLLNAERKLRRE